MKLKSYPEYNDSGVNWIGKIPKEWEVKRIKDCLNFQIGGTPSTSREDYFDGENVWVSISDLNDKDVIYDSKSKISDEGIINSNVKKISKGSLLFSFKLTVGLTAFAGCDLYTNEAIASFSPNNKVDLNFLKYVLQKDFENNAFENIYGAKLFNSDLLGSAVFVLPPEMNEQKIIASFLNKKTSEIDFTIEKDTLLIELLKEKRTALINHVVTKGLDPMVKMKDSGVEWIGEIPEDWNKFKIKHFCTTTKGLAFKTDLFQEKGVPVVKATDIKNETIIDGKDFIDDVKSREFSKVKLNENDIILSTVGSKPEVKESAVGQFAIVPKKYEGALLNQNTVRFELIIQNLLDKDFFTYVIRTKSFRKYLDIHAHGTANQASLNVKDILDYVFYLPSINEQRNIIPYLDNGISRIDKTIHKINKNIVLLEEYKKSLIHHVVTGKVDVREVSV